MSLRSRALLAVALTVSFYLFALAIALGLIATPIAFFATSHHGNIWIAIGMIGAGLAILRAIIPPRSQFEPPGPELRASDNPRLAAVLDDVARKTGEQPADAVYLDLDLNASVFEHKGRRMMVLGLPLLAALSPDELRAVVAHEYGHYAGGDTRFAVWIWRTRHAVLRTVHDLATSESGFRRSVVRLPFEWYARLFLRITNAISRKQEFAADQLSLRVAPPEAAGSALRRLEALSPVFDSYWGGDVIPMLQAKKRPPIAAGFAEMAAHSDVAPGLDDIVKSDIEAHEHDPYASHPTLRERLTALGAPVEATAPPPASPAATDLLEDIPSLERALLVTAFGEETTQFAAADWDEADGVHAERMRDMARRFGNAFPADLTIASAGAAARDLAGFREPLRRKLPEEDGEMPAEAIDHFALNVLGALVTSAAVSAGARLSARPGDPVRIVYNGAQLDPWSALGSIAFEGGDVAGWEAERVVHALGAHPLRVS